MGDYEIRREKVGTSYVYEEVKYIETGSGKIIKERTSETNTWKMSYYHTNHQGSTSVVTANNGRVDTEYSKGRLRYFPYGEQITSHNINTQVVADTYTGQKKDTETDLMFYNARLYNQNTGLFMQADSVNDGLNRYAYVSGNPINATDPSGNIADPNNLWGPQAVVDHIKQKEAELYDEGKQGEEVILELLQNRVADNIYVYSNNYGIIDMKHVIGSANALYDYLSRTDSISIPLIGDVAIETLTNLPFAREILTEIATLASGKEEEKQRQVYGDRGTYFSYEDIPSNYLGFDMAIRMYQDPSLSLSDAVGDLFIRADAIDPNSNIRNFVIEANQITYLPAMAQSTGITLPGSTIMNRTFSPRNPLIMGEEEKHKARSRTDRKVYQRISNLVQSTMNKMNIDINSYLVAR